MRKIRRLSEVPYTAKRHRAFRDMGKGYMISDKWLRMAYRDLCACLEVCDKLLAVRVTLTYPKPYDASVIDPGNNDIRQFIQQIEEEVKTSRSRFIGYSYVREFGYERGKKHYHCVLYFDGYRNRSIGNIMNEGCSGIHGVLERSWGEISDNPHVHIDRIITIDNKRMYHERQLINEELFYYLCKLESKLSDGYKNYGRRVVAEVITREGKKKEDAQTSSLNYISYSDNKNKSTKVNTDVCESTSYNASSVENNDTVITFDKNRYDVCFRYFTQGWEGFSRLLITGIKTYLPDHIDISQYRTYIKQFSDAIRQTLKTEENCSVGDIFGTLLKEDERYYIYTVLFMSGHRHKKISYRKGKDITLFDRVKICWESIIGIIDIESHYSYHIPDKSVYESRVRKNECYRYLAKQFLSLFINDDIHSRHYVYHK